MLGYNQEVTPGDVETILGVPRWTFLGIFLPWLAADVITTWFCFRFLKEDDLGQADDEESADVAAASNQEGVQ